MPHPGPKLPNAHALPAGGVPRPARLAAVAALLLTIACGPATGLAAVSTETRVAGRKVLTLVPDHPDGPVPLVVALHGCDQSAADFAASTGLDALADSEGFALAFPEARAGPGNPLGCWPWWDPENQRRGGPETAWIVEVTRSMSVPVDPRRIYVLGLSSGGAMAVILGTVYPDVFAAMGVHSGIGFAAAGSAACAVGVLHTTPADPDARGELGYLHQSRHRIVPTMIIQGQDDAVVEPGHAEALVRETAQKNDLIDDGDGANDSFDAQPDEVSTRIGPCPAQEEGASCHPYRVERFRDRDGNTAIERVLVDGLGHAWSGGRAGRGYADARGPNAGALFLRFFREHRLEPGTLQAAAPSNCRDWWAPPWWQYLWAGTMSFGEYLCDMNPWRMVWRHTIDGVSGPGRCP